MPIVGIGRLLRPTDKVRSTIARIITTTGTNRSVHLRVSLADRAAVVGVILANNRAEIGAALPARNKPSEANFALISGALIASENEWMIWFMVACGVFAGATTPP